MNIKKKLLFGLSFAICGASIIAPMSFVFISKNNDENAIDRIEIDQKPNTIRINDTFQLTATVYDKKNKPIPNQDIQWVSSNPEIIEVNDGLLTPKIIGTSKITVICSGKIDFYEINVLEPMEYLSKDCFNFNNNFIIGWSDKAYTIMENLVTNNTNFRLYIPLEYSISSNAKFSDISNTNSNISNASKIFIQNVKSIDIQNQVFDLSYDSNENEYNSAYYMFGIDNDFNKLSYNNLEYINLLGCKFIPDNFVNKTNANIKTASNMFANCKFPKLISIDLNSVQFSGQNLGNTINCHTGYQMFINCEFDKLTKIYFQKTMFVHGNDTQVHSTIYSASSTFRNCIFTTLTDLDMSNCIFSQKNMTDTRGNAYIASQTFCECKFLSIEKLDLGTPIFDSGDIDDVSFTIGFHTFADTEFNLLKEIDLTKTRFAVSNISDSQSYSLFCMFYRCSAKNLEKISISETTIDPRVSSNFTYVHSFQFSEAKQNGKFYYPNSLEQIIKEFKNDSIGIEPMNWTFISE